MPLPKIENMAPLPMKIIGCGRYMPRRVVTNEELEARCELPAGWIETKTGVRERRWVERDESSTFMGAMAAREALDDAGIAPADIDLIMNASGSPPRALPDGGHLIQRELGLGRSGIPCMTVHTTCLSFVTGLNVAANFLATGQRETILIVTSDISSRSLDFSQPESAILLGDGAAACVVTRAPEGDGSALERYHQVGLGDGADLTTLRGMGTTWPPNDPDTPPEYNLFYMDGLGIAAMLRGAFTSFLETLTAGLSRADVAAVVPHQANAYALRALRRYGFPEGRIAKTLDRFGNCVAASIPLTLYEVIREGRISQGDRVLLLGAGAGLCIGGILLTY